MLGGPSVSFSATWNMIGEERVARDLGLLGGGTTGEEELPGSNVTFSAWVAGF